VQVDQISLSGIVERYIVFKTSGSVKERTKTSTEMGAGLQAVNEMGVGLGEKVCRKCHPYIRQLANEQQNEITYSILLCNYEYLWTFR